VPSRLKRYQRFGSDHFITFSCYRRLALLNSDYACRTFEHVLEDVRRWYDLYVFGYVIMPDHVHLLVSEPREGDLRTAIQMLKQLVARRSKSGKKETRFWQARYYDFNVTTRCDARTGVCAGRVEVEQLSSLANGKERNGGD
jgi:putative transposase